MWKASLLDRRDQSGARVEKLSPFSPVLTMNNLCMIATSVNCFFFLVGQMDSNLIMCSEGLCLALDSSPSYKIRVMTEYLEHCTTLVHTHPVFQLPHLNVPDTSAPSRDGTRRVWVRVEPPHTRTHLP
jgi:hypothetical protein